MDFEYQIQAFLKKVKQLPSSSFYDWERVTCGRSIHELEAAFLAAAQHPAFRRGSDPSLVLWIAIAEGWKPTLFL
jgi:hypothetical protein